MRGSAQPTIEALTSDMRFRLTESVDGELNSTEIQEIKSISELYSVIENVDRRDDIMNMYDLIKALKLDTAYKLILAILNPKAVIPFCLSDPNGKINLIRDFDSEGNLLTIHFYSYIHRNRKTADRSGTEDYPEIIWFCENITPFLRKVIHMFTSVAINHRLEKASGES